MSVQIHRLGNRVALYLRAVDSCGEYSEPGVTFYLSSSEARELSDLLHQYAVSCDNVPFVNSTIRAKNFDWNGSPHNFD